MNKGALFCATLCAAFLTGCVGNESQSSSQGPSSSTITAATDPPKKHFAVCADAEASSTILSKTSADDPALVVSHAGNTAKLFASCSDAEAKAGMVKDSVADMAMSLYASNLAAGGMHFEGDNASARRLLSMTSEEESHFLEIAKAHGWSKLEDLLVEDVDATSKIEAMLP